MKVILPLFTLLVKITPVAAVRDGYGFHSYQTSNRGDTATSSLHFLLTYRRVAGHDWLALVIQMPLNYYPLLCLIDIYVQKHLECFMRVPFGCILFSVHSICIIFRYVVGNDLAWSLSHFPKVAL